jgi:Calcineurin-like phosphoesterase
MAHCPWSIGENGLLDRGQTMRLLAIGDIHGCATALETLLGVVQPKPSDQIIALGDYVDRGPESKGVLERLIALHVAGQLIALRGNHEVMMLGARDGGSSDMRFWLNFGGIDTLESYAPVGQMASLAEVPATHWHFLKHTCIDWYETDSHIFVHANLDPDLPLHLQQHEQLHWAGLHAKSHRPHVSGKVMICGHTEQQSGLPLNLGSAVCIDTWVYGDGWLTCLDVHSGEYWQANELGQTRCGCL